MLRSLRWVLCLPLALLASVIVGALANVVTGFLGGASWYAWMLSGAGSAIAFYFVAYKVAPAPALWFKWTVVGIIGTLGALAAVGPVLKGDEPVSALAGMTMVGFAILMARQSVDALSVAMRE